MITHLVSQAGYGVQDHSPEQVRGAILGAEAVMRTMPQVEIEPIHTFAKGLYSRTILVPKGMRITGKVHKQDDLQIMVSGDMSILTDEGVYKRLQGYHLFKSKAGTKQIGVAHEDTLWVTVHATESTDLDELEQLLFEDEPKVLDFKTGKPMEACVDYHRMLAEVGIPHETAWAQSIHEGDRRDVDLPGVTLGPSPIHGTGVFATQDFWPEDPIGMARIDGLRTQLGRYTNHSHEPNALMVLEDGQIYLKALAQIREGEEITTDYRASLALSGIKGVL